MAAGAKGCTSAGGAIEIDPPRLKIFTWARQTESLQAARARDDRGARFRRGRAITLAEPVRDRTGITTIAGADGIVRKLTVSRAARRRRFMAEPRVVNRRTGWSLARRSEESVHPPARWLAREHAELPAERIDKPYVFEDWDD
jgi:hypothetical protein